MLIINLVATIITYCIVPVILLFTVLKKKPLSNGALLGIVLANSVVWFFLWRVFYATQAESSSFINTFPAVLWGCVNYMILRQGNKKALAKQLGYKVSSDRNISDSGYINDDDFGLVPEKPIITRMRKETIDYINNLSSDGETRVKWVEKKSESHPIPAFEQIRTIDVYKITDENNTFLYFDSNGGHVSPKAPFGFSFYNGSEDKIIKPNILVDDFEDVSEDAKNDEETIPHYENPAIIEPEQKLETHSLESLFVNQFNLATEGKTFIVDREGISFGNEKILFQDMTSLNIDEEKSNVSFDYKGKHISFDFNKEQTPLVLDFFKTDNNKRSVRDDTSISEARNLNPTKQKKKTGLIVACIVAGIAIAVGCVTYFNSSTPEMMKCEISQMKYKLPANVELEDKTTAFAYINSDDNLDWDDYLDFRWFSGKDYDIEVTTRFVQRNNDEFAESLVDVFGEDSDLGIYESFNIENAEGQYGTYTTNGTTKQNINILRDGIFYSIIIYPNGNKKKVSDKILEPIVKSISFSNYPTSHTEHSWGSISISTPVSWQCEKEDDDGILKGQMNFYAYGDEYQEANLYYVDAKNVAKSIVTELMDGLGTKDMSISDSNKYTDECYYAVGSDNAVAAFEYFGETYVVIFSADDLSEEGFDNLLRDMFQ